MSSPKKFERIGASYVGYAVAMRSPTGAETIILCPTKDEAILAGEAYGTVDPAEVKRAAIGPVGSRPVFTTKSAAKRGGAV